MTEIIAVRFKAGGKQYYFDPQGLTVPQGAGVIVETGKGVEYGTCSRSNAMVRDDVVVQPLRPVVRLATQKDEKQIQDNHRKEKEAMKICQQLVERHGLDMKLVEVEYSFDGSKIIFFFTSEGRVDFRALVKDLASIFRSRIELRQIGVRDEARMLGGLGICGKPFCCHQFLDEFQPVSIKMAKTQNLSLNPTKISGTCGRLMCCLKYEQEAYEDAVKRCPKQESFVECPDGVGNVTAVNLLREQVKVRLEDSTEQPKTYRTTEIRVVRNARGKPPEAEGAPPSAAREAARSAPRGLCGSPQGGAGEAALHSPRGGAQYGQHCQFGGPVGAVYGGLWGRRGEEVLLPQSPPPGRRGQEGGPAPAGQAAEGQSPPAGRRGQQAGRRQAAPGPEGRTAAPPGPKAAPAEAPAAGQAQARPSAAAPEPGRRGRREAPPQSAPPSEEKAPEWQRGVTNEE